MRSLALSSIRRLGTSDWKILQIALDRFRNTRPFAECPTITTFMESVDRYQRRVIVENNLQGFSFTLGDSYGHASYSQIAIRFSFKKDKVPS